MFWPMLSWERGDGPGLWRALLAATWPVAFLLSFLLRVAEFQSYGDCKLTRMASSCFAITSARSFMSKAILQGSKAENDENVQLTAPDSWPDRLPWPPCSPPLQHLHLQPSSSSSISRQIHLPPPPFPLGSAHPWRRRTLEGAG